MQRIVRSLRVLPRRSFSFLIALPLMLVLGHCGGCGAGLSNLELCQDLVEDGTHCPEGVNMFVRTAKRLHLSGEPSGLEAGDAIELQLQYLPTPEEPEDEYAATFNVPEDAGDYLVLPIEPGRLKIGAYRLMLNSPREDFQSSGIEFSVWRSQADIDRILAMGDENGMRIKRVLSCAGKEACEEDQNAIAHGTQWLGITFEYEDALDDTVVNLEWRRDGRAINSQKWEGEKALSGSGTAWAGMGYESTPMPRGRYEVVIQADKSKQGILRKRFTVR